MNEYPASYRLFQFLERSLMLVVYISLLVASSIYWFPESKRYVFQNDIFEVLKKAGDALAQPFTFLTEQYFGPTEFPIHLILAFMVYSLLFFTVHTVFVKLNEIS